MKHDSLGYFTNGIAIVFSALQTDEVLSYISWGLTLLATMLTIAFTIWKWYKKATADGKITPEEIEEGIEIVKDSKEKIDELGDKKNGK